jgi:hypothetical protein
LSGTPGPNYRTDQNPVAILQLCVSRRCLIFELLHADYIPSTLGEFLGEPAFHFIGVGVDVHVERLGDDHELKVANSVDLQGLAAEGMHLPELCQAELRTITTTVMGVTVVKPQRVTMIHWDVSCLSYCHTLKSSELMLMKSEPML